jgi:hypothetical protein
VTSAFSRGPRRSILLTLKEHEVDILRNLFSDLLDLLNEDAPPQDDTPVDAWAEQLGLADLNGGALEADPTDPALARLFPAAYPDDPAAAAEFRRYTQPDLRAARRKRLAVVIESLASFSGNGRQRLDAAQSQSWLGALNDLRLVLGTRLGITEDDQEAVGRIAPEDPLAEYLALYYYLGYLQETLLETIAP